MSHTSLIPLLIHLPTLRILRIAFAAFPDFLKTVFTFSVARGAFHLDGVVITRMCSGEHVFVLGRLERVGWVVHMGLRAGGTGVKTTFEFGEFLANGVSWQGTSAVHVWDIEPFLPSTAGQVECGGEIVLFYFVVMIDVSSNVFETMIVVLRSR